MRGTDHSTRQVLVTGANGFLGSAIASVLERGGYAVVRGARTKPWGASPPGRWTVYGDIGPHTEWSEALRGVGTVVHLAGIAHVPDRADESICHHVDRVNVGGTQCLARAAATRGVKRFILMSTALVHGTRTDGSPISETSPLSPSGAYARSKQVSEQRLREAAAPTSMEIVILRPPMVYGPRPKGNFARLVRLVRAGLPLPLGAATAPRSFVCVENLAHAVKTCVEHPSAAGEAFLVCDEQTSSTADLIEKIAVAVGQRVINVSVPPALVCAGLLAVRRGRDFDRLFAPFALDGRYIRTRLGWRAPITLAEGIAQVFAQHAVLPDSR